MRIKKWSDFKVNESFGISRHLFDFIKSKSVDWSEFMDSLEEVGDISNCFIEKKVNIVDQNGHLINVDFEEDKQYRFRYSILIKYYAPQKLSLELAGRFNNNLSTIIVSTQEMIDRVNSLDINLIDSSYSNIVSFNRGQEVLHQFIIEFESEILNIEELKNTYNKYLDETKFTPEFNAGIKKLVERYKRENINLMQFLDTASPEQIDTIMVGFVTEDDIYGIADYDIKTKKFTIDETEIEESIDWYREEHGFD